ncbi:MAG: hypothetical protein ACREE0_16085 [Phenylobacterium sp.]
MTTTHPALDADEIARARALLKPLKPAQRLWPVLTAAAFLAISALAFATAMVLAPPLVSQHVAKGVGS